MRRARVALILMLVLVVVSVPIGLAFHIVDVRNDRRIQTAQKVEAVQAAGVAAKAIALAAKHQSCLNRQTLYDGQIAYTRDFLGPELRATPAQITAALANQRRKLGARPVC